MDFIDDLCAACFEFLGTTFFLFLGLGGIQAAAYSARLVVFSPLLQLLVISTSMGLSLLVSAWLFFRTTGALFNPDVALALVLVGIIGPVRFVLYCLAQLAAAIVAAALVEALTPGPLASNTFLGSGINSAQGVFIEMFITAALIFTVLVLVSEKSSMTRFAPIGIGLTYFACHLFAVPFTGASMNSARSFGPAALTRFRYRREWVYWVGPTLGCFLATVLYLILKHFQRWSITAEQKVDDVEKSPQDRGNVASAGDGSRAQEERAGTGGDGGTAIPARAPGVDNAAVGVPSSGGNVV